MKKILTALCLLATAGAWAAPQLIAHRGGTGDAPENTLPAIKLALENNAEAIWVTVQLSRDGVPVLYRSSDLSALTNSEGKVSSLTAAELAKVDAGWNRVYPQAGNRLFQGIEDGAYFYFVHSYAMPVNPWTIAQCNYGEPFTAAVQKDNFYGVQFHPERSGAAGAKLLKNFLEM